ncbi:hypothetical protein GWI33_020741 [Rhynchophorus ferrugineus]|uniref:Uncharacterized protein n=1 Tax=Rhynchophorus ferrugineus TaxID=354439 RepID=A0A834M080_RHYFE|nr:hypothetical protein GWI33_020741 [Rhynchophorus ferrugineus]
MSQETFPSFHHFVLARENIESNVRRHMRKVVGKLMTVNNRTKHFRRLPNRRVVRKLSTILRDFSLSSIGAFLDRWLSRCALRGGEDARVVGVGRDSGHPEVVFRYGSGNCCGRITAKTRGREDFSSSRLSPIRFYRSESPASFIVYVYVKHLVVKKPN